MLIFNRSKVFIVFVCIFFLFVTSCRNEKLTYVAGDGNISQVKTLIEQGADVNLQDDDGDTALTEASAEGHIEIVKYLVENGADINVITEGGYGALRMAELSGHLDIVEYLESQGATE